MDKISIGRDSGCDIVINDSAQIVSRVHAELTRCGEGYYYHDLSANGSLVNGRMIKNEKIFITAGSPIMLAGKFSLPWDKVTALLAPVVTDNGKGFKTNIQGCSSMDSPVDKTVIEYYFDVFKKYAIFSGRSRRKEYWSFFLINLLIGMLYGILASISAYNSSANNSEFNEILAIANVFYFGYALASFLPGLALSIRRLHDIGKSGWWYLIGLVPLLGAVVLLIFMVMDSDSGANQYGHNPKI